MLPQILTINLKISSMDLGCHRIEVLIDGQKIENIVSVNMKVIIGPENILKHNHTFVESLRLLESIPKFKPKLIAARI